MDNSLVYDIHCCLPIIIYNIAHCDRLDVQYFPVYLAQQVTARVR